MQTSETEKHQTKTAEQQEQWTAILEPRKKFMQLNIKELWDYRDLFSIYVRRNIVTVYKQTNMYMIVVNTGLMKNHARPSTVCL